MKKIIVFFCGWGQRWQLGTLAQNEQTVLFEYSAEALAAGVEFSPRQLRLRTGAFTEFPAHQHRLPGLVADALPDGWGMLLMDRFFKRSAGIQPFQLTGLDRLAFIGERGLGALSFVPAADLSADETANNLLELARQTESVIADKDDVALRQLLLVGGSPQGARPKALVHYDPTNNHISNRENASGTPWLVKFPGKGEHKEVCAIENCYAELARECGLDMPETRYFDLDRNHAAFGIARFDRQRGMRVPMHTLAGALHADFKLPGVSYQTFLRCTRLFTRCEIEVKKAFERCVFNVIFHNRDDHAKNFSFLMDETLSWKLAPCYDLTFSEGPGGEHHMDVEGEGLAPQKEHLMQLAESSGIPSGWAADTIERIASVASNFKQISASYAIRQGTRKHIATAIQANRDRMR